MRKTSSGSFSLQGTLNCGSWTIYFVNVCCLNAFQNRTAVGLGNSSLAGCLSIWKTSVSAGSSTEERQSLTRAQLTNSSNPNSCPRGLWFVIDLSILCHIVYSTFSLHLIPKAKDILLYPLSAPTLFLFGENSSLVSSCDW